LEEGRAWRDILESRCGTWRDMKVTMAESKSLIWWSDLCRICEVEKELNWFDNRISWKLRYGKCIKFWEISGHETYHLN